MSISKHLRAILICLLAVACTPAAVSTPPIDGEQPTVSPTKVTRRLSATPTLMPFPTRTQAPTWTPLPTATSVPTFTPYATAEISGTIPLPTATINPCQKEAKACEISVYPSDRAGWCQMDSVTDTCSSNYDYSLLYPEEWTIIITGTLRPDLSFETGIETQQIRLFQLQTQSLSIVNADQAELCDEDGVCNPVVDALEIASSREFVNLGSGKALVLTSYLGNAFITRYFRFIQHPDANNRLYILELRIPRSQASSQRYADLQQIAETLFDSILPNEN